MTRNVAPSGPLYGLVLAGGRGTRLQRDKGALEYHDGVPQAHWALQLLKGLCEACFVSIRPDQAATNPYRSLPSIIDRSGSTGPASGLLSALQRYPCAGWLVIAADMPLLEPAVLQRLVAQRDPAALATAYRHTDGTPEPLCAIWEPAVLEVLEASGAERGISLRRVLEAGPAKLLAIENDRALRSVNTPADDAIVRRSLVGDEHDFM